MSLLTHISQLDTRQLNATGLMSPQAFSNGPVHFRALPPFHFTVQESGLLCRIGKSPPHITVFIPSHFP